MRWRGIERDVGGHHQIAGLRQSWRLRRLKIALSLVGCPICSSQAFFLRSLIFSISPAPATLANRSSRTFSSASVMFSGIRLPLGLSSSAARPPQAMCARFTVLSNTPEPWQSRAACSRLRAANHLDPLSCLGAVLALERSSRPLRLVRVTLDYFGPRSEPDGLSESRLEANDERRCGCETKTLIFDSKRFGDGMSQINLFGDGFFHGERGAVRTSSTLIARPRSWKPRQHAWPYTT
jgi:hypothetical protein